MLDGKLVVDGDDEMVVVDSDEDGAVLDVVVECVVGKDVVSMSVVEPSEGDIAVTVDITAVMFI